MAIKAYSKKDCKGKCTIINSDHEKFGNLSTLGSTASIELTSDNDKVLLFKKKYWDGEVIFRSGKQVIADLDDPAKGGKKGFRNSLNSIRISNFKIRMKYHVAIKSDGTLPNGYSTRTQVENVVSKVHIMASNIWEKGLIELVKSDIIFETDDDLFNGTCGDLVDNTNYNITPNYCHVFLTDTLPSLGCAGPRSKVSGFMMQFRNDNNLTLTARTLAHELGHNLGLGHKDNTNKNRLLTQTGASAPVYGTKLMNLDLSIVHEGISDKKLPESNYRREN